MAFNVKIKLTRGASLPEYATGGSAALDLRAALEGGCVTIAPGARALIPTGVAISPDISPEQSKNADGEISGESVVAVVAARSGLAIKSGITLANGIGVIDSDYRGEIFVGLLNTSAEDFAVHDGDRIAQLMFMPVLCARLVESQTLDQTDRGGGGFGSTGIK